jgi:hypothetical protein
MKILRIIAKKPGFRRAGLAHPDHAVDHRLDAFTPDEVEALKSETMLVVQELDVPDPEPESGKKAKGGKAEPPAGDGQ